MVSPIAPSRLQHLARGITARRVLLLQTQPRRSYAQQQQQQQQQQHQPPPPLPPSPPKKPERQVSPHIGFYKSFGRPIAKVLLMSVAVYQLVYWAWKKLEADEIRRDKLAEVRRLEAQLEELAQKQQQQQKGS